MMSLRKTLAPCHSQLGHQTENRFNDQLQVPFIYDFGLAIWGTDSRGDRAGVPSVAGDVQVTSMR